MFKTLRRLQASEKYAIARSYLKRKTGYLRHLGEAADSPRTSVSISGFLLHVDGELGQVSTLGSHPDPSVQFLGSTSNNESKPRQSPRVTKKNLHVFFSRNGEVLR